MKAPRTWYFLVAVFVLVIGLESSRTAAQMKLRTVDSDYSYENSPFVIVNKTLRGEAFTRGSQAYGDHTWLRDLEFTIKNVSQKPIRYFLMELLVEKQARLGTIVAIPVEFPQKDKGKHTGLVWNPGTAVKLSITELNLTRWGDYLKQYGVVDLDRVRIHVRMVEFDDGTGWSFGREMIQDPLNKGTWIYVPPPPSGAMGGIPFLAWALSPDFPTYRSNSSSRATSQRPPFLSPEGSDCAWRTGFARPPCDMEEDQCNSEALCVDKRDILFDYEPVGSSVFGAQQQAPHICEPHPEEPNAEGCVNCQPHVHLVFVSNPTCGQTPSPTPTPTATPTPTPPPCDCPELCCDCENGCCGTGRPQPNDPLVEISGEGCGGGGGGGEYFGVGWNSYYNCTDWYWVEFHCEPLNERRKPDFIFSRIFDRPQSETVWECTVTNVTYAGCW